MLGKISIFEMPRPLVHVFVSVDNMLWGTVPVMSWSPAIKLIDELRDKGCPKKALLEAAQEILISEQTKAAMAAGTPSLSVASDQVYQAKIDDLKKHAKPINFGGPIPYGAIPNLNKPNFQQIPKVDAGSGLSWEQLDAAKKAAEKFGEQFPVQSVAPAPQYPKTKCVIEIVGESIQISTPWNQDFIATLKTLPAGTKKWNPVLKRWVIDIKYKNWVASMIQQHFPGSSIVFSEHATTPTVTL